MSSPHNLRTTTLKLLRSGEISPEEAANRLNISTRQLRRLLADIANIPHNLPRAFTSFIGRQNDLKACAQRLTDQQMLTLVGPGGCGKTRLAIQLASDLMPVFPDGVWYIDLTPVTSPALVPSTVSAALGLVDDHTVSPATQVIRRLSGTQTLLIFDNCEHLIPACAALLGTLLQSCPSVKILATSREPLYVSGEVQWPVAPLDTPPATTFAAWDGALSYDAVKLFVDRAAAVSPSFEVTGENVQDVCAICRCLDGIPLAIELAATRIKALSAREIARKLTDGLQLLATEAQSVRPRQQTLYAALEWSHHLLTPREQALWRRVSVFKGGFTLEAAQQICAGEDIGTDDVLYVLASLVEKSLIVARPLNGESRYHLLETTRQYCESNLRRNGEWPVLRDRHAAWFLRWVETNRAEVTDSQHAAWLDQLEADHDNCRQALWSSLFDGGSVTVALRMCTALGRFWNERGHLTEGRKWLADLLGIAGQDVPAAALNQAIAMAGSLAWRQGDDSAAQRYYEEFVSISRKLGDERSMADGNIYLGMLHLNQDRIRDARAAFLEALSRYRLLEDKSRVANALMNLGVVADQELDFATSVELYRESLAIQRELKMNLRPVMSNLGHALCGKGELDEAKTILMETLGSARLAQDKIGMCRALVNLGLVHHELNDLAKAQSFFEESIVLAKQIGYKPAIGLAQIGLGHVALHGGDLLRADAIYRECLSVFIETKYKPGAAVALLGLGITLRLTDPSVALQLFGAAESICPLALQHLPSPCRSLFAAAMTNLRAQLSASKIDGAWHKGSSMDFNQSVMFALGTSTAAQPTKEPGPETWAIEARPGTGVLTPRESEVANLVAKGCSNKEIAAHLYLSPRTVEVHLRKIYEKFDVSSRGGLISRLLQDRILQRELNAMR